tara:strand:- start:4754 stop:7894 length:3141 start_codon:yes stop_codon:yes gene_type:complete
MRCRNKILKKKNLYIIKEGVETININKLKENPNNNLNNNYMDTFKTFKLRYNSKLPTEEWKKDPTKTFFINRNLWKEYSMEDMEKNGFGLGVPTGKINGNFVLDLDLYDKKDKPYDPVKCLFRQTFGCPLEYIKKHNLFAVQTISGGIHIYFKYDNRFKQTTCAELQIDIRSDGGYIVAPFTKINGNSYKILHNGIIKNCPEDMCDFVLNNVVNRSKKKFKTTNSKVIIKNPITGEDEVVNQQDIDLSVFNFDISDYLIKNIIKGFPDDYFFEDYQGFLIFTTAMKQLDKEDLWRKIYKSRVNSVHMKPDSSWKIEDMWFNARDNNYNAINHILLASKYKNARTALDYYKYKPVPINTFKPDYIMNEEKLGYDSEAVPFFKEHSDRVVIAQSDTGTGKTTEAKRFFRKNERKPFISIVSRVSLGLEQVQIFKNDGLEVEFHETYTEMNKQEQRGFSSREGENIVITIDSLLKLKNFEDFNGYIIFLDEYNSLIEYLITCPLLNKSRQLIVPLFEKMILQADKVIATDADINEISLSYMKQLTPFKYIKNEYKHNNGIPAEEVFSFESFVDKVNKESKWLIPCDSKTQSEIIGHINASTDYVLITSEGWYHSGRKEYLQGKQRNLDLYDRIIFSPAIVYGLDSTMKRPVFCYFKEHTISPVAMVQQACRCRNIEKLYFLFTSKKCKEYHYHSPEHAQQEIEEREEYGVSRNFVIDEETGDRTPIKKNDTYNRLLSEYIYRADCYNTNKFAHFIKIIRNRGFKVSLSFHQTKQTPKEAEEQTKEEKIKFFNECCDKYIDYYLNELQSEKDKKIVEYMEDWNEEHEKLKQKINDNPYYTKLDLEDHLEYREMDIQKINAEEGKYEEYFSPAMVKLNDILKLPYRELGEHIDLVMNPFELQRHFTISKYFRKTNEELEKDMLKKSDFNPNKANTIEAKLMFLNKYRELLHMNEDIKNVEVNRALTKQQSETFMKEYKIVFERFRGKKIPDFTETKTNQQYISKIYKNLFGEDCIDTKKTTKNKKSITLYSFNTEYLDYHNEVYKFRQTKN